MSHTIDYKHVAPGAYDAMVGLERYQKTASIERPLLELIKIRASQLNGCAFCLDMHTRDAIAAGESHKRLHVVAAWREANCFTERERAALAWTEALTQLARAPIPEELHGQVRETFSERELVDLTLAVSTINSWNRLAVSFGLQIPD